MDWMMAVFLSVLLLVIVLVVLGIFELIEILF